MKRILLTVFLSQAISALAWDNNEINAAWQADNLAALQAYEPVSEFEALYLDYRIAMVAMRNDDKKLAKQSLERIQKSLKNNYQTPDEAALYSASLGLSITLSPFKAVFIGKQAEEALADSEAMQPNHAPTMMVRGIALYNTPSLMGGDREKAAQLFQEALEIYQDSDAWGQEDAWLWYVKALNALEQPQRAQQTKAQALAQFPDYLELQELL